MSKILHASCVAGIVTAEGVPVEATVQSEGVGASEGLLILDEDRADYIAKTSPNLKSTIEDTISALNSTSSGLTNIVSALTTIGTAAGVSPIPLAALILPITLDIVQLTAAIATLTALKESLK